MRLADAAVHDHERVAYLDGPRSQHGIAIVTTVTIPSADERRGNFHVSAPEMIRAGQHLRRLQLMRLAQIHCHPAGWTGHSPFSQRDGAISIVVPQFAACAPGLTDCGGHVRDSDGWHELGPLEKSDAVHIFPSLVDLRR